MWESKAVQVAIEQRRKERLKHMIQIYVICSCAISKLHSTLQQVYCVGGGEGLQITRFCSQHKYFRIKIAL